MFGRIPLLLAVLVVLFIGIGAARRGFVDSEPRVSPQRVDRERQVAADPLKRRDRSVNLTVDGLCERIAKAKAGGREGAVLQAIGRELGELSADRQYQLLIDLESSGCSDSSREGLIALLVHAIGQKDRILAADLILGYFSEDPERWNFFISLGFFDAWAVEDLDGLIGWLAEHRDLLPTERGALLVSGETAILTLRVQEDPQAALARVKSLPKELGRAAIDRAFNQRWDLLEPDQSIEFLREAFDGDGHEELVGTCCGYELYEESWEDLDGFFARHDASPGEREEITFRVVSMRIGIGLGNGTTPGEYLVSAREFAAEEAPAAVDRVTAMILGTEADRTHRDKKAVDQLFQYDVGADGLRLFLETRGTSIDPEQKSRVDERLGSAE